MIKKIPVIFRQTPVIDRRRCAVEPCSCQRRLTRLACTRLQEAGLGPVQLLARAGLTIEQIKDHRARVSVACQIRLLTLAASAIDDELLGFHLAPACDLRELGLIEAPAQAAPLMVRAACSRVVDRVPAGAVTERACPSSTRWPLCSTVVGP